MIKKRQSPPLSTVLYSPHNEDKSEVNSEAGWLGLTIEEFCNIAQGLQAASESTPPLMRGPLAGHDLLVQCLPARGRGRFIEPLRLWSSVRLPVAVGQIVHWRETVGMLLAQPLLAQPPSSSTAVVSLVVGQPCCSCSPDGASTRGCRDAPRPASSCTQPPPSPSAVAPLAVGPPRCIQAQICLPYLANHDL